MNTSVKINTFQEFGLPEALLESLTEMEFTKPTPIQSEAIPVAMSGSDILGSAQTGTGKTAAFGIPLITKLLLCPNSAALVITPTRELAAQVVSQLKEMLGRKSKIKAALLIGGDSMYKQLKQLQNNPRLIVGTPGRINDHLERGKLKLGQTNFLVLDEMDRMLDMGFSIQIDRILEQVSEQRQTLLFSATIPRYIVNLAKKYMVNPVQISTSPVSSPAANIQQETIKISEGEKYSQLITQLGQREGSVIVFVKTKHSAQKMADRLAREGHRSDAIHGDLRQSKRGRVIAAFRNKKYRVLVATDVAARGLDIPHIEHVINFDLPQCPEDYIHRIGRTARAGASGAAVSFVTPSDGYLWKRIHRIMNPGAAKDSEQGGRNDRFDRNKRYERSGRGYSRNDRNGGGRNFYGDRNDRGGRSSYGERSDRGSRSSYGDRNERGGRSSHGNRNDRGGRSSYSDDRSGGRSSHGDRNDRGGRGSYGNRNDRSSRNDGGKRGDSGRYSHSKNQSQKPVRKKRVARVKSDD